MTFHLPFGTELSPLSKRHGPFDLFSLSGAVGFWWPKATNTARDVAKLETLFAAAGSLDLAASDGPTSTLDPRFGTAVHGFQNGNDLRVDGLINPDGSTL
jgi:hypothetical protein